MPDSSKRRAAKKAILDYITSQQRLDNPKDTKADVMRSLAKKGCCSEPVGHALIIELEKAGKLKILKDKPNSQYHHLIVNDKNEFIKIDKALFEIDGIIDLMREPLLNIYKFKSDITFPHPYKKTVETMLQVLLVRTNRLIHSKDDAQTLYTRITELLLKLILQFWNMSDSKTFHPDSFTFDLNSTKSQLLEPNPNRSALSVELRSNLIKKIENFEKLFLSDSTLNPT